MNIWGTIMQIILIKNIALDLIHGILLCAKSVFQNPSKILVSVRFQSLLKVLKICGSDFLSNKVKEKKIDP